MITNYDLKKNNYSDQKFAKDIIKRLDKETTLLVDGAYYLRRYSQESQGQRHKDGSC